MTLDQGGPEVKAPRWRTRARCNYVPHVIVAFQLLGKCEVVEKEKSFDNQDASRCLSENLIDP